MTDYDALPNYSGDGHASGSRTGDSMPGPVQFEREQAPSLAFDMSDVSFVVRCADWLRYIARSPDDARFIMAAQNVQAVYELAQRMATHRTLGCVSVLSLKECSMFGRRVVLVSEDRPERAYGLAEVHGAYLDGELSDWFVEHIKTRLASDGRLFRMETP